MLKIFKDSNKGFRIKLGAFYFRWFKGSGCRFIISFSNDTWIRLFGFNQKNFGV